MINHISKFLMKISLFSLFALLLYACGGGGGSSSPTPEPTPEPTPTTLSGTAAAGAPIIGTVTVKDSSTPDAVTRTVTIEADGDYTVDVSDLTAPFMVRADGYVGGNEYHLYSAGTAADVGGTINITPLTDLIVANIAGTIAEDYFESEAFSSLTADQLTDAANDLRARLLPVLQEIGVSASIDLLRASFNTDHSGLDLALDILRVDIEGGVATIENVITGQQIQSTLDTGDYSGDMDITTGLDGGLDDIQAIVAKFNTFSSLFVSGLPSHVNPTLLGLFDQENFLMGGQGFGSFLTEMTTEEEMIGLAFTNISILEIDIALGTALVGFEVMFNGEVEHGGPKPFYMIKNEGVWYMQGDKRVAEIEIDSGAEYRVSDEVTPIYSGLGIYIDARETQGLTHAIVRGAGLPAEGVRLDNNIQDDNFEIEGETQGSFYVMDNESIAEMPDTGATYTVELFKGVDSFAIYDETLRKRPSLVGGVGGLTSANFPVVTAPTVEQLRAFNGGSLLVTWTLPTGLSNDWLNVRLNGAGADDSADAEYSPSANDRSKTVILDAEGLNGPFTVTNRSIWLAANDSFGRRLATSVW